MKIFLRVLLGLLILAAGIGVFAYLEMMRPPPEKREPPDPTVAVIVRPAERPADGVTVRAMGTVVPSRQVTVVPEVGGRVLRISEELVPGGRVAEGELLVRIDPRDYDLAVEQQRAAVQQAELNLATERARKAVAEREWALIADEVQPSEEGRALALREIQLDTARAALESAKSALDTARLARRRTAIHAPFDAVVISESVDAGQVVGPGAPVATLVAADACWVRVSLPLDRLPWIALPGAGGEGGAEVRVTQRVGSGRTIARAGRVRELLGDLDPLGKMARLLVEVPDPLGEEGTLPLLIGAYVDVEIEGPDVDDVVAIPRTALREDDAVWVARDGALAIEAVEVVWTTEERAFVRGAVAPEDAVITSRVAAPVAGMPVRRAESDAAGGAADPDGGAG